MEDKCERFLFITFIDSLMWVRYQYEYTHLRSGPRGLLWSMHRWGCGGRFSLGGPQWLHDSIGLWGPFCSCAASPAFLGHGGPGGVLGLLNRCPWGPVFLHQIPWAQGTDRLYRILHFQLMGPSVWGVKIGAALVEGGRSQGSWRHTWGGEGAGGERVESTTVQLPPGGQWQEQ